MRTTHDRPRFSGLVSLVVAGFAAATLSGCTSTGGEQAVRETTDAFLQQLVAGDESAAFALTTTRPEDTACAGFVDAPGVTGAGIDRPEVGGVVVDGRSATAEVSYTVSGEEFEHALELKREADGWKVVLPDSFRIRVPVPPKTVAQLTLEYNTCDLRQVDGIFEAIALPGAYSFEISDPVGVFSTSPAGRVSVPQAKPGDGIEYLHGESEFPSAVDREIAANLLADDLGKAMSTCVESGFSDALCPDGLPQADEHQDFRHWTERLSAGPRAAVFSDDGRTWRFTTDTQSFRIQVDGVLVDAPFTYTGSIEVPEKGVDLIAVFD